MTSSVTLGLNFTIYSESSCPVLSNVVFGSRMGRVLWQIQGGVARNDPTPIRTCAWSGPIWALIKEHSPTNVWKNQVICWRLRQTDRKHELHRSSPTLQLNLFDLWTWEDLDIRSPKVSEVTYKYPWHNPCRFIALFLFDTVTFTGAQNDLVVHASLWLNKQQ